MSEWLEELHGQNTELPTLLALLAASLDAIHLLPPQYRSYNTRQAPVDVLKHVGQVQHLLLTQILPTWGAILVEKNVLPLAEQFFCPDGFVNSSSAAGRVAITAYATLVSSSSQSLTSQYALKILDRLCKEYPIDRLHIAVHSRSDIDNIEKVVCWEDAVRNLCMVPAKVANALGEDMARLPASLENATYFDNLCVRCEVLVSTTPTPVSSITYLLDKLVKVGVFPAYPPIARSQPSFFKATLPTIRARSSTTYSRYWASLFLNLSSSLTLQAILTSLFASLRTPTSAQNERTCIRQEAALFTSLVGKLTPEAQELWEITMALVTCRSWSEYHARIFVCWTSGAAVGQEGIGVDLQVLDAFLEAVLDVWASPEHIKHSIMSQHRYMTSLLLITVSYFPKSSSSVLELASTVSFINAIGVYISHLDASVRRCGMLAAEVVAHLCDKKLDFGDWDGDGFGKPWCRSIRSLLESRDVDAPLEMEDDEKEQGETHEEEEPDREGVKEENNNPDPHGSQQEKERPSQSRLIYNVSADYDSDDSITGYASPPSSRSASPSPSELAAIEKDPTLNVGLKKVPRPVYLAQLGDLFRGGSSKVGPDDPHEADRIEMALNTADELIRRKKGFGTELDENAVNLVFALLGLQDNFDLEGFAEKRQGALNALVACSPRKAAPVLIQEFFKNQYSADQRFVALNALAIGARELASLPVPASRVPVERTAFPSKRLPEPLHRKYITANTDLVPLMVDDLSKKALEPQQAEASTSNATQFVRERRLRIGKTSQSQRVIEVLPHSLNPLSSDLPSSAQQSTQRTSFIDVAAEYFIMPLISSFWSFLRDEQAREERTAHREGRYRYQGTGTGLILNPLVLAQFVRTLAILVNASVHAPEWLSVIAPEALELAITIGTRPMSITNDDDEEGDRQSTEASLLTSTLELALVVLDGALNIDGGRILGLEYTTLVLGVEEWAGKIFKDIERGLKLEGGGGAHEIKLSRAAAGVLLKIDELTSKWRMSMLDTR